MVPWVRFVEAAASAIAQRSPEQNVQSTHLLFKLAPKSPVSRSEEDHDTEPDLEATVAS